MNIPKEAIKSAAKFVDSWAKQTLHTPAVSDCCHCNGAFLAEWASKLIERIATLTEQLHKCAVAARSYEEAVAIGEPFGDEVKAVLTLRQNADAGFAELAQARAEIERLKLQSEHADCWWNDDNRVGSPEEYADEEALKVGEEFELLAAAYWPTKYRVTAVRDHETDEGEYTCELLKGRREEFETYFQIKSERDSLRAQLEQMGRPVTAAEFSQACNHDTAGKYLATDGVTMLNSILRARQQEKP